MSNNSTHSRKLQVYVAGPSSRTDLCEQVIAALVATGNVQITHDWTQEVSEVRRKGGEANSISNNMDKEHKKQVAHTDIEAVKAADLIVLIHDLDLPIGGAFVELGAALALGVPVVAWVTNAYRGLKDERPYPLWLDHNLVDLQKWNLDLLPIAQCLDMLVQYIENIAQSFSVAMGAWSGKDEVILATRENPPLRKRWSGPLR